MAGESEFLQAFRVLYEQGNRAWNEGDIKSAYAALPDHIEYRLGPHWPNARPLRGRAEVIAFFEDFQQTFSDAKAGPLEFIEVDEHRVIVGFPVVGTGSSSGARISMEIWQLFELEEGIVPVRLTEYVDREAALAAAGLSERTATTS